MSIGTLYLVPAPLDMGSAHPAPLSTSLPDATLRTAASLRCWICENAKTTRAYLKRIAELHPLPCPLQEMSLQQLPHQVHKHGDHRPDAATDSAMRALLEPALQGQDMGLISEAGMPAIADPGASVVRAAHTLGLPVVPLAGPVSLMLALAASGLNGQNFAFVGYLPQDAAARSARIRALESHTHRSGQTQICIETPYRNAALLQALLQTLQPGTRLSVSSGLTLDHAQTRSATVQQWRAQGWALDADTPAVFVFGA